MISIRIGRWSLGLVSACFVAGDALAQPPGGQNQAATQADHRKMMDLLGIKELRRGRNGSGNPSQPNFANYDEAKANPFPKLPDPLVTKAGKAVTTAEEWWKLRRPEIVEDFDREVYGRVPKNTPKVKWEVVETSRGMNGTVSVVTKRLLGHVDNSTYPQITVDIQLTLTTPENAAGPVPVMMQFGFGFGGGAGARGPAPAAGAGAQPPASGGQPPVGRGGFGQGGGPGGGWQQQCLAKGWGYAVLSPGSIQADNGAGLTKGIIGLCNKGEPRKVDDWGSLRAWAWGASRALDYFETDKAVDAKAVGVEGHSRYGKATPG